MNAHERSEAASIQLPVPVSIHSHVAALLVVVLAVGLVYGRAKGYGFMMLDDFDYMLRTPELRDGLNSASVGWAFTTFRGAMWMPLTWLSFLAEIELFGIDPGLQHAVNIALHAINVALFYLLAMRILGRPFIAWTIAMLFAIHPIHVESVAWIAERKDVLFACFYLAALNLYLSFVARRHWAIYLAMLAAACASLLAKPMAVSLPVAMLLLNFWPLQRFAEPSAPPRRGILAAALRVCAEIAPVAMLAAATAVMTLVAAQPEMSSATQVWLPFRLGNAVHSVTAYLADLLLPLHLAAMYPLRPLHFYWELLPAGAVFVACSVICIAWRRSRPWLAFAWLWFLVVLLPASGLFQIGAQARADRFVYVPALGIYLAIGAELARVSAARLRSWRGPIACILALYGLLAWIQVGYWASPYMFATRLLDVVGDVVEAHTTLAEAYLEAGDVARAAEHAEAALRVAPQHYLAFTIMGNVLLAKREYVSAEPMFRRAMELRPDYDVSRRNLAISLRAQGRDEEARHLETSGSPPDPQRTGP